MSPPATARTRIRSLIDWNRRISLWADRLAGRLVDRTGGLADFSLRVVPLLLRKGLRVLDVGGGRAPSVAPATIRLLGLHVTGLDISEEELRQAPADAYQATIVGNVMDVAIPGKFDLILSRAVLEHVADTPAALANLASALADGGRMAHVVPCRRAPFAVANRLLGNRLARRVLLAIYPERVSVAGFRAFYRLCVPSQMAVCCRRHGLDIEELTPYFASDYLQFCAPLHLVDLCRQALGELFHWTDWAETFILVARKPAAPQAARRAA